MTKYRSVIIAVDWVSFELMPREKVLDHFFATNLSVSILKNNNGRISFDRGNHTYLIVHFEEHRDYNVVKEKVHKELNKSSLIYEKIFWFFEDRKQFTVLIDDNDTYSAHGPFASIYLAISYCETTILESFGTSSKEFMTIEFLPEQKQAGIQILAYFQEILDQKYPDIDASVRIGQRGNTVTMEVETADGQKELIEKTFEEYQLVISGQKAPEEFLENKLQIAALENEVRIALMRAENAQSLLQVQSDVISDLKEDKRSLQLQLASALHGQRALSKDLSKLVKAVVKNNNVEHVFRMLELSVGQEPSESQIDKIKAELEIIKAQNPKVFKDFVKNVTAGIVTNVTSPWFIQLVNSIPT